jgi:beta-glucuronidase
MPVPSSYQDIVQDREIMDYWGYAWYDYQFIIPQSWSQTGRKTLIRFSSVRQDAIVFVNGINVVNHTGGNLPFEADITKVLLPKDNNLITVVVSNVLSSETIPQGSIIYENDTTQFPKGFTETDQHFDFFNYAGIDRHVHLYNVPETNIKDIIIYTSYKSDMITGTITYAVILNNNTNSQSFKCLIQIYDDNYSLITSQTSTLNTTIDVPNATLWWPFTMNKIAGYQYTLKFTILNEGQVVDVYSLKTGIREISVTKTQFLINGKPFYFRGFGKHEDSNVSIILKYFLIII